MLTSEELRAHLDYDPDTVAFFRRKTGKRAGGVWQNPRGMIYRAVEVKGVRYYEHRLAWFYMTGKWPEAEIDHRDCDGTNNKWSNLREATHSQNNHNRCAKRNNSTGFKGVSRHRYKYTAEIMAYGKKYYLGTFSSALRAHLAYRRSAKVLHGEFAKLDGRP